MNLFTEKMRMICILEAASVMKIYSRKLFVFL